MIPIRDLTPSQGRPWVTWSLIGVNVAVFTFQWALGTDGEEQLIRGYGLVPAALLSGASSGSWITPLTHMFLHGGVVHVAANMWFLHIFGDNVEEALGRWRYLAFYVLCGLAAATLQVAMDPSSTVPMVGASGAIAGVLGAALLLFPRGRVLTLVPVVFFIELPSVVFIVVWFGLQLAEVLLHLRHEATAQGGVAFFAHIGGFVTGLALAKPAVLLGRRGAVGRPPPNRRVRAPWDLDRDEER